MRVIELTRGQAAIVDDEDFDRLAQYRWCAMKNGYAHRCRKVGESYPTKCIYMHRYITGAKKDEHVDHINGDVRDNRRCNLRICNRFQNLANRGKNKNNSSGFKGVCCEKRSGKFLATISANGKTKYLGRFTDAAAAHAAYCEAAKELHKDFARFN